MKKIFFLLISVFLFLGACVPKDKSLDKEQKRIFLKIYSLYFNQISLAAPKMMPANRFTFYA